MRRLSPPPRSRSHVAVRTTLRALVAALPLLACAPRADVEPSASARSARRAPLVVLVYNIHAGKDAAGVGNLDRVAELARAHGADVVLLQEVDRLTTRSGGVDQLEALAERTALHGVFGRTLDYQGGEYGIALLSRYPVTAHALVPLPTEPPQPRAGGSREPRGALVATLAAPGGPLHVVNTHLDASGDTTWRMQEVRRLAQLADSLRATGAPVVVGGDLNATPESAVIGTLAAAGLRDGWAACGGEGAGLTFPARAPVKRIDYLFLAPGVACRGARVLASEASDHRALLLTLER